MKFEDLLNEMSIAAYGDWDIKGDIVGRLSKVVLNLKYKKIKTITIDDMKFDLYNLNQMIILF